MLRKLVAAMAILAAASPSLAAGEPPAVAPALSDEQIRSLATELGACLVGKTTGEDRVVVARWIAGAVASAPQVAALVKIDAAEKDQVDRAMAKVFTRLMTVDCLAQAKPLLKAGSRAGFEIVGESLGRIAVTELLNNPQASNSIEAYARYLDRQAFEQAAK